MPTVIDVTERPIVWLGAITFRTIEPDGIAEPGGVGSPAAADAIPDAIASTAAVGVASTTATVSPSGVAGGVSVGTVTAWISAIYPDGVAGAGGSGSAQANLTYNPIQIYPAAVVGTATSRISILATSATSSGGVGSPRLAKVMNPTGIGSSEAFGTASSSATVLVVPGPFDPSNDFGDPLVTKRGWIFRGPTIQLGWRFQKRYEGVSLLKESGSWVEVSHPDLERTRAAEKYLPGGHDHVVSDSLKAELVSAGYTVTSEVVTTEEYKS